MTAACMLFASCADNYKYIGKNGEQEIAQQAKKRMEQEAPELRYEIKHINQSKKIIKKITAMKTIKFWTEITDMRYGEFVTAGLSLEVEESEIEVLTRVMSRAHNAKVFGIREVSQSDEALNAFSTPLKDTSRFNYGLNLALYDEEGNGLAGCAGL